MTQRLNDYFAAEASEYLEQLEALLALPGTPDAEQFLRLATGVRGSAQMAGAETVAGVAERLEDAARSIVSNNVAWSDEIRRISRQTVGDLELLIRALNRWGEEEERRVREAILRWDDLDAPAHDDAAEEGHDDSAGDSGRTSLPIVPIESLFYDDAGPHVIEPSRPPEAADAVPIEDLLLRGDRALEAALMLRPEVDRLVATRDGGELHLADLVTELFDLIELGRHRELPEA